MQYQSASKTMPNKSKPSKSTPNKSMLGKLILKNKLILKKTVKSNSIMLIGIKIDGVVSKTQALGATTTQNAIFVLGAYFLLGACLVCPIRGDNGG